MTLSMLDEMIDEKLKLLEALETAKKFISDGIKLGHIHLPEEGDPANGILGIIDEALREAGGEE